MSDQYIVFELKLVKMLLRAFLLEISLTLNSKVVFCLSFICKHKENTVITICCNLTKACLFFAIFIESLYKNMGILP